MIRNSHPPLGHVFLPTPCNEIIHQPNIYQEKMSTIFSDMENIICFIDDIALIMNGSFENHLNQLDEILQ
jgi:hypothetical protein